MGNSSIRSYPYNYPNGSFKTIREKEYPMNEINTGDTAWILVATALVMVMTPALAFFYGGMVRKKNLLSTINLSFITIGLISLQWVLIGYTLAFGTSMGGLFGGLDYLGLSNVGAEPIADYAPTIPALAFAAYQ